MWTNLTEVGGVTNAITLPDDGIVSIMVPSGVELCAYVNGVVAPLHHVHVKAGDTMYFELKSHNKLTNEIKVDYNGTSKILYVIPKQDDSSDMVKDLTLGDAAIVDSAMMQKLNKIHKKVKELEMTPAETINLFANPGMGAGYAGAGVGAGAGAGLGAGLLGGVLGGALLGGRNGLLGGNDVGVGSEAAAIAAQSALINSIGDGINHNINTSTVGLNHNINTAMTGLTNQLNTGFGGQRDLDVMQKLGSIEGDIWKAEGQGQLALAQAQGALQNQIGESNVLTLQGQALINKNISDAIAASLASQSVIRYDIATTSASNLAATLNSKYELSQNIRDDGDKTRALIVRQYEDTLNRQLAVAQDALIEQRSIGRSREVEVNVTQQVTQNQAQLQAQQQQQQQFLVTNNLLQAILCQAQVAQATNQNLIIGNTGAVASGPQTANPVNVRA